MVAVTSTQASERVDDDDDVLIMYRAKQGVVPINISASVMAPFGFSHDDVVSTPFGRARVIGVFDGNLYFHVDGDEGASYWGSCRSHRDFVDRGFTVLCRGEGGTNAGATNAMGAQVTEYHSVKEVVFRGSKRRIVLQNHNGPCPIVALANVLVLRGDIEVAPPTNSNVINSYDLRKAVAAYISTRLDRSGVKQSTPIHTPPQIENRHTLASLLDNADVVRRWKDVLRDRGPQELLKLYDGQVVSPIFYDIDAFDDSESMLVFPLADVKLTHGWLISSDSALGKYRHMSYEELCSAQIAALDDSDQQHVVGAIEDFLVQTQSQLTPSGLERLRERLPSDEPVVFFRNNHFSTLLRHGHELFVLCSDEGFSQNSQIVFEGLTIDGNNSFFTGDLMELTPPLMAVLHKCTPGASWTADQVVEGYNVVKSLVEADESAAGGITEDIIVNYMEATHGKLQTKSAISSPKATQQSAPATNAQAPPLEQLPPAENDDNLNQLVAMGFEAAAAREALAASSNSLESAVDILTSAM